MHINRARTFRALSKGRDEGRFTWLPAFAGCGHFWCFLSCALGVLRGARGCAGGSWTGMGVSPRWVQRGLLWDSLTTAISACCKTSGPQAAGASAMHEAMVQEKKPQFPP